MALTDKRKLYLRKWYRKDIEKNRKRQLQWQKNWRINNPEEVRKKDKLQRIKHKEKRNVYAKEYQRRYKKDPIKVAARTILNNAIRLGKIKRPKKCDRCSVVKRIEAHHADYYKPLEVLWLCSACHGLEHHPH